MFQSFTGVLDEAGEALDRAVLFLRQHITADRKAMTAMVPAWMQATPMLGP